MQLGAEVVVSVPAGTYKGTKNLMCSDTAALAYLGSRCRRRQRWEGTAPVLRMA